VQFRADMIVDAAVRASFSKCTLCASYEGLLLLHHPTIVL
jgi:hypothetical protein